MTAVLEALRLRMSRLPASVWVVGCAVAALMLYLRSGISEHFTHVDDVGVAFALVSSAEHVNPEMIRAKLDSASVQPTRARRLLKALEHTPLFSPAIATASFVGQATEVPSSWTYAPLQFFGTAALVRFAPDYERRLL